MKIKSILVMIILLLIPLTTSFKSRGNSIDLIFHVEIATFPQDVDRLIKIAIDKFSDKKLLDIKIASYGNNINNRTILIFIFENNKDN